MTNGAAFGCLGKGNDNGSGHDVRGQGGGSDVVKTLKMINDVAW